MNCSNRVLLIASVLLIPAVTAAQDKQITIRAGTVIDGQGKVLRQATVGRQRAADRSCSGISEWR
jgi:hypothetical protein